MKNHPFISVPCMAYNLMVKVHYTCKYLRSIRETQRINREVGAKGSVEQIVAQRTET